MVTFDRSFHRVPDCRRRLSLVQTDAVAAVAVKQPAIRTVSRGRLIDARCAQHSAFAVSAKLGEAVNGAGGRRRREVPNR
jgi:hypothetical protein